jgi:hypothetical protein
MNSNNLSNIVTSFTLYKFLDTLTMPFIQTDAYRLKIIDAKGNLLKDVSSLNPTEKAAYNDFYQLVFSLKRLLLKVPDPYVRSSLRNVTSALKLISEQCEQLGGNAEQFMEKALREMDACRLLEQEGGAPVSPAPVNSVGGGGIAGMKPEDLAVSVEAQRRHTARNSIFKRKKPNTYFKDKDNSY